MMMMMMMMHFMGVYESRPNHASGAPIVADILVKLWSLYRHSNAFAALITLKSCTLISLIPFLLHTKISKNLFVCILVILRKPFSGGAFNVVGCTQRLEHDYSISKTIHNITFLSHKIVLLIHSGFDYMISKKEV